MLPRFMKVKWLRRCEGLRIIMPGIMCAGSVLSVVNINTNNCQARLPQAHSGAFAAVTEVQEQLSGASPFEDQVLSQ